MTVAVMMMWSMNWVLLQLQGDCHESAKRVTMVATIHTELSIHSARMVSISVADEDEDDDD